MGTGADLTGTGQPKKIWVVLLYFNTVAQYSMNCLYKNVF